MQNQELPLKRHVAIYGSHEKKSKRWELSGSEQELNEVLPLAVQHPPKRSFVRFPNNPFPKVVLGDWHDYICKIDLDNCFSKIQPIIAGNLINNRFNMDGFRIYQSGFKTIKIKDEDHNSIIYKYKLRGYHIVFNRKVEPMEIKAIHSYFYMHIKNNWNIVEEFDRWSNMQNIKQTDTLRVGFKGKKKPPKEVFRFGNQDKMIAEFEDNRNYILNFLIQSEKRGDC